MRDPITIDAFEKAVQEKKRAGLGARSLEMLRNDGRRRSPAKRALLVRTAKRAANAGIEPYAAAF